MGHSKDLDGMLVREVWAQSLSHEFELMATAASDEAGVILALDTEFPGLLLRDNGTVAESERYRILRENVDTLRLIQLGLAVAGPDGVLRGVWSFNLKFDVSVDLHSTASVNMLRNAGIDFARHATEGIDQGELGRKLAASHLVGWDWRERSSCPLRWKRPPLWVTFSGDYDLGFLLKLLTPGRPLPTSLLTFMEEIGTHCPSHMELRDRLPRGSLEKLAKDCGIRRVGAAHTAGSDALLTLGLFLHLSSLTTPGFAEWSELGWCLHDGWDLQNAWAALGYAPVWNESSMVHWLSAGACQADPQHLQAEPQGGLQTKRAQLAAIPVEPDADAVQLPPCAVARLAVIQNQTEEGTISPSTADEADVVSGEVSSYSESELAEKEEGKTRSDSKAVDGGQHERRRVSDGWHPERRRGADGWQPGRRRAVDGWQPGRRRRADHCRHGNLFLAVLRAGVFGWPGSLAPPPLLCLSHLFVLCLVFPPTLDTLLFLPLQVVIVLLLCCSGLVPQPPQNFLTAYVAGSCARFAGAMLSTVLCSGVEYCT
uniref:poly(A)-specific ribonuclease n=1 Tax=Alexandrium monilatum TaxID=311494 RepID=A0A7S4VSD7_9DINO